MTSSEERDIERLGEALERLERGDALPPEVDEAEVRQARADVQALGEMLEQLATEEADPASRKAVEAGLADGLRELRDAAERARAEAARRRRTMLGTLLVGLAAAVLALVTLWRPNDEGPVERDPGRRLGSGDAVRLVHPVGRDLERFSPFQVDVAANQVDGSDSWTWTLRIWDATTPGGTEPLVVVEDLDRASWEWQGEESELPKTIRWEARVVDDALQLVGSAEATASRR